MWNCKGPVKHTALLSSVSGIFLCERKVPLGSTADNKIVQFCVPGAATVAQVLYLILYEGWLVVKHCAIIS